MTSTRIALFAIVLVSLATALHASPLETLETGQQALRSGNHETAIELYGELVAENPFNGSYWGAYAIAHHISGHYVEAISAWEHCLELGFRPRYMMFNLACAHTLKGDVETALDWIERAYSSGFVDREMIRTDTDLDALRDHPRFKQITGLQPDPILDRSARWQRDIEFMRRRMEEVHWDLYANVSKNEFLRRTDELSKSVAEMEDNEILVELRKIVVLAGDGHTSLRTTNTSVFPIDLFWFEEGVFVRGARESHRDLVGKRVVAIGDQTTEEALNAVEPLISRDNDMWVRQMSAGMLRNPTYLNVLGVTPSAQYVTLTVEDESGRREPHRIDAMPMSSWGEVVRMHEQLDSPPLYLQEPNQNYWFTHLEDQNLVYFQYNSVRDQETETIAQFTERLFSYLDRHAVEHLVLDIRFNHGGNSFLNRPLIQAILASPINERGRFWVVIGRGTFSAAQNFASDLDFRTEATFVGEPTGSRPNFVGETSIIVLPYSNTAISVSSRYHQHSSSNDYRFWIPPAVAAPPTWASYAAGKDPALEAILGELKAVDEARTSNP
jgi:tetratricopeptide (TPR) repeat protein